MSAALAQKTESGTVRRRFVRLTVVMALLLSVFGLSVAPASAATNYGINANVACHYTYNGPQYWADFTWPTNPFSWVCRYNSYTVSAPPSATITTAGGVDFQKYCNITYPRSRAVIVSWNVYGWRCQR
jgi:hypothetical protein